ncbi:hypothetical protein SIN07_04155 [Pediococcus inopinatus]|uniref:Uncharacterized protein n=1 Tax=Pediococcus inopinatus TaxID=114090 RepID=A0ABZ0Q491_9LACO|nr:hypothetical protein [Pediococcus inopinatus]WPC17787.1 hypothetical protein N6G94_01835 [Pediococcus inopinatus]WPC19176.1 hypothetical protein N6G95_08015 [Pediococcus inopinatus]WPC20968.1 hypothetical protein N6G96_06615 [Pediococcus inopinatus]WPP10041.1 hypothetical protein SIN07_04155 [Pediococcus inopinatus]
MSLKVKQEINLEKMLDKFVAPVEDKKATDKKNKFLKRDDTDTKQKSSKK